MECLVGMVIVPASTGQMGVLSAHEGNDMSKYFVSSGFAFVHMNSIADIVAIEATPVDHIDPNLVQKGLAEFQPKLISASTDVEKAEAEICTQCSYCSSYRLKSYKRDKDFSVPNGASVRVICSCTFELNLFVPVSRSGYLAAFQTDISRVLLWKNFLNK